MALMNLPSIDPLTRGSTEYIEFKVYEPGEDPTDPDAEPQNLSGCTLRFGAKYDLSDTTYVVTKSSENAGEIVLTDSAAGEGYIKINKTDLLAVTYETTLICDLEITDASDEEYTLRFRAPLELDVST